MPHLHCGTEWLLKMPPKVYLSITEYLYISRLGVFVLAVISILLNLCLLMFPALAFPHLDSDGLSAWLLMLLVADLWLGVGARTGSRVLLVTDTVDIVDIVNTVDTVDIVDRYCSNDTWCRCRGLCST